MKIKNVLHNAALRLCLLAIAMGTAAMAYAAHTPTDPQPSDVYSADILDAITKLSINADGFNKTVEANKYYDGKEWYKYQKDGNNRGISTKLDEKCFQFKVYDGIAFKIQDAGKYYLTARYYSDKSGGEIGYYISDNYSGSPVFENFYSGTTDNAFKVVTFTINISDPNKVIWVSGATSEVWINSITLRKVEEPQDLTAITSPYFWYYNGGGDFGLGNNGYPWGNNEHYRYQPNGNIQASYTKIVYINGDQIGGNNGGQNADIQYGSYIFKTNYAIGIKLDNSRDYRIKVYLYNRDGSSTTPDKNKVLYKGANVSTASRVDNNVSQQSIMINNGTTDTQTRLITYEINKADAGVYWIKNAISEELYIGGFEVLPKNYPTIGDTFTGTSWNVAGHKSTVNSTMSSTMPVDYAVDKSTNDNVAVYGPAMALNATLIDGKTVMLNNGNKFGINLQAGATLSFTYIADPGVSIKITDEAGNTLKESTNGGGPLKVYYPDENTPTTSAQKVWITGSSDKYVYFSGFEVKQPESTGPSIDDVTPIDKDYVWYLVSGKDEYIGAEKLQADDHTFLQKGFATNKPETYTLYNRSQIAYRTDNSVIGFKIKSGKKGVINIYYKEENTRYLYLSEDGTDRKLTNGTISDTKPTTVARWHFDTTGGTDKTYWITNTKSSQVWFMGYEVLFDEGNNGGVQLTKNVAYNVAGTETLTNAIGSDTYSAIKSGTDASVGGSSMILRDDVVANGAMVSKIGENNWNAILVKIPADCKMLNVKGYLDNATIKIYRGSASAPNTSAKVDVTGSGVLNKEVLLNELSDVSGDVYWITSNNAAGAFLTSVTPKESFSELQPTDVNYIYKVDSELSNGVQVSGDTNGRIMFVDANGSAWSNTGAKMNVLGEEVTPVAIENGKDFFAVKVDEGPYGVKTGYIKVYFNGGSAAAHKMEELPLDNPLYAGWNSSYNPDTHIISFDGGGGGRGWWFGNEGETGVRDLSQYNKINIELGTITGNPTLKLVVQSTNGAGASFEIDSEGRLIGDLTDQSKLFTSDNGATFDITKVSQIYIQDNNTDATSATIEIKSARLMNKPIVIAKDNDQDPTNGYTELFGGKIYDLPDGKLYEYPFDLSKASSVPQLTWITGAGTTGTTNIAAIEVIYDSNHAKVVEWYVNKDTKMIVGSDDPSFKINFQNQTLEYPTGYDEYVTFYMSSGRQANVSFIMPEAVREVDEWFALVEPLGKAAQDGGDYVKESKVANIANTYGKHTIDITGVGSGDKLGIVTDGDNKDNISFQSHTTLTYDRDNAISADRGKIKGDGPLYRWYNYAYNLPANIFDKDYTNKDFAAAVKVTATQKVNGSDDTETVGGKVGQWKIYMRFISFAAPEASRSGDDVSVAGGQSGKSIYYTLDSSEPENLGDTSINSARSTTEPYNSSVNVADMNCIFKAAQYINTDFHFYEDISKGKDSAIGNVFKVVSRDLAIENEISSVVYVKNKTLTDNELFNEQPGGYMLTIPTGDTWAGKTPHEQKYNANPFMYLTLGGKDWPYYIGNNAFNLCGTNWQAKNDGGLKTYLDSYQYKMDVADAFNIDPWKTTDKQNQNPYTECNGGVGGSDTEDGGMFLQPIGGTSLRFEPEYDGVITVWLRQNGCLDSNTMESGTFNRRPVYVMDENGRIMRRSTIRPTASHYMGINGTWGINSSVCEQRSQVENTWIAELAKQIYQDHPLYGSRFATKDDRWATEGHDHSGHILYGWWYKGFNLNATRSTASSAAHVSRFEYMEPELLYRSDGIFNMEMNQLGLTNAFAKYGFELPNFQYVRYRIPVKAGKTYYIAGRGTKNGFAAIRFDALAPNTNLVKASMEDLRYTDNPEVIENQTSGDNYLKLTNNWENNGSHNYKSTYKSTHDLTGKTTTEVSTAYNYLTTQPFSDTGESNSNTINSIVNEGKSGMDYDKDGNLVGKTINFTLTRTFRAYNWHPIILPFSLSETRVEQYFGEGTKILYLDPYVHSSNNQVDEETGKSWISVLKPALEGTKLSFTIHRYQMLYANTPAFICPTFEWSDGKKNPATNNVKPEVSNGSVTEITFMRVTLDGSNSKNDLGDGCFGYAISNDYEVVGSYDQKAHHGDIYYVNNTNPTGGLTGNTAQLVHSENKTVTMKGFRAWIRLKGGSNAAPIKTVGSRGFSDFEEDSDLSGISDIVADDYTIEGYDIEDDSVYDLLGRKIGEGSLDGLQKGIYIFHGRKVYVK